MHSRVARVMLLALLLAVGLGAALQISFLLAQSRQLTDDQRALLTLLARFDALAADVSAAQAAYVAPGQSDAPWFDRVSSLSSQLATTLSAIRVKARSADVGTRLQTVADALSQLAAADTAARDHLRQEQDLMAADVVFGEARAALNDARAAATGLGQSEQASFDAALAAVQQQIMLIAGIAAGIWVIGLGLLVPRPRRTPDVVSVPATPVPGPAETETAPLVAAPPIVDLAAAADLCSALSRIVSAAALPDMLARTAALLDASGVIVWMGTGDELFAATSHGYNPRVISRLGAIRRDADNATADAWRTGELRTVPGDMMSNGAIVAPMFGPDSCVGVLAAEVRHGREQDASTQAVTMMVAAQLATVLAAWPSTPPARAAEA